MQHSLQEKKEQISQVKYNVVKTKSGSIYVLGKKAGALEVILSSDKQYIGYQVLSETLNVGNNFIMFDKKSNKTFHSSEILDINTYNEKCEILLNSQLKPGSIIEIFTRNSFYELTCIDDKGTLKITNTSNNGNFKGKKIKLNGPLEVGGVPHYFNKKGEERKFSQITFIAAKNVEPANSKIEVDTLHFLLLGEIKKFTERLQTALQKVIILKEIDRRAIKLSADIYELMDRVKKGDALFVPNSLQEYVDAINTYLKDYGLNNSECIARKLTYRFENKTYELRVSIGKDGMVVGVSFNEIESQTIKIIQKRITASRKRLETTIRMNGA